MIRLDVTGDEWRMARIGIPTASQFHRIITPKTRKPSSQADGYMAELLAEWITGEPIHNDQASGGQTAYMTRGSELEADGRRLYEFANNVTVSPGGFCLLDDRSAGASPDGLIGDDGALEIKSPGIKQHILWKLYGFGDDYRCQVQGGLWITERKWWDLVSYNPDLPPVSMRVERDEEFIALLAECVADFNRRLAEARDALTAAWFPQQVVAA